MITKAEAINSLRPKSNFVMVDDVVTEWLDEKQPQPTDAEIDVELVRLQNEYAANEYQRKRAAAYPSFADQLDTIYHDGLDAWKEQIQAVKDKYPKA